MDPGGVDRLEWCDNSTANLEKKDGKLQVIGNSTEGALLQWINESGYEYIEIAENSIRSSTRCIFRPSESA